MSSTNLPQREAVGMIKGLNLVNGTPLQYSCLENPMDGGALVGCSPWGREEPDTTERLHFHFSLKCIGEGNGNPLQCSCLENPRNEGAWWAAVYGVAQSWTQLSNFTFTFHFHALEKEMQPTPVFLPGESQGRGSLVGCHLRGCTESDTTEMT